MYMYFSDFRIRFLIFCIYLPLSFVEINGGGYASAPRFVGGRELGNDFVAGIGLTWYPPLRVNGTMRGYKILYAKTDVQDNNHTLSASPSARSIDINGLKHYTKYTILVRAYTNLGVGDWSSPIIFRTREGTPSDVCEVTEIFSPSPTTVFVRWKPLAPEFHNGILRAYLLMWLAVTDNVAKYKSVTLSLNTRNFTITGLKPYTAYYTGVIAANNAGFFITNKMIQKASRITTQEDVPSRSPSNVDARYICHRFELQVSWTELPDKYIRGKLQGYKVMLYQGNALYKDASVKSKETTSVIVLDECRNYTVEVAAFTTPGTGPNSTLSVISSCSCGPPQPLYSNRTIVTREGSPFLLPCEYRGRPEPTVHWIRDGKRLREETKTLNISELSGNISYINKESELLPNGSWHVSYGEEQDSGYYTCVLNSTFGLATSGVALSVAKAKNVVTIKFHLTLLNKTFHNDLNNRRSPMFIKLSSEITEQMMKLFGNTSTKYKVKVVEVVKFRNNRFTAEIEIFATVGNPSHRGFASKAIKERLLQVLSGKMHSLGNFSVGGLVLPESPPSPRYLKVVETKQNSLQFSWSPPRNHEAYAITGYTLQYKKVGQKLETSIDIHPAGQYTGTITNLASDTSYEVVVEAHNQYGTARSEPITAKTSDWTLTIVLSVAIPLVILIILAVFLIWWRIRRIRQKYEEERVELEQMKKDKAVKYSHQDSYNVYELGRQRGSQILFDSDIVREWWEIPRDSLQVGEQLGSGAFGEVKKGILTKGDETVVCAIKMLKRHATETEYRDLLNELNIMANVGEHANVISLIGACTTGGPLWLVVKFAENGSLISYLQSRRQETGNGYENIDNNKTELEYAEKLKFAYGIARGMSHLAKQRCVHRDLAARNVLLGENNRPMVSDFGLSRDIYESGQYEKTTGGKLPVKWMAIESLEDYIYTIPSDVWSYGIVLWEIETGGRIPYPGLNGMEILSKLKTGYRLEKPDGCSMEMYNIMWDCWMKDPSDRPNFAELVNRTGKILQGVQGYEDILHEDSTPDLHASYDNVDIHESLLDLPEACADEVANEKKDASPKYLNPGEKSESLGSEKCTSQPHVDMSATEENDGESKASQEKPPPRGSETVSFCNEYYKLSQQQQSKQRLKDIGDF